MVRLKLAAKVSSSTEKRKVKPCKSAKGELTQKHRGIKRNEKG
jgi:hypothetical protein